MSTWIAPRCRPTPPSDNPWAMSKCSGPRRNRRRRSTVLLRRADILDAQEDVRYGKAKRGYQALAPGLPKGPLKAGPSLERWGNCPGHMRGQGSEAAPFTPRFRSRSGSGSAMRFGESASWQNKLSIASMPLAASSMPQMAGPSAPPEQLLLELLHYNLLIRWFVELSPLEVRTTFDP
jgi:hypothetical protein